MAQEYDDKRLSLVCLRWVGCNLLAVALYLPFGWRESGYGFPALPLFVMAVQAFYLRRDCPWWLWIGVSFVGCVASLLTLMLWGLAIGCTMSLVQAACLLPRSIKAGVAWAILGPTGWIVAAFVCFGSDLGTHRWAIGWSVAFLIQGFFLLPAVVLLDRVTFREEQGRLTQQG